MFALCFSLTSCNDTSICFIVIYLYYTEWSTNIAQSGLQTLHRV